MNQAELITCKKLKVIAGAGGISRKRLYNIFFQHEREKLSTRLVDRLLKVDPKRDCTVSKNSDCSFSKGNLWKLF